MIIARGVGPRPEVRKALRLARSKFENQFNDLQDISGGTWGKPSEFAVNHKEAGKVADVYIPSKFNYLNFDTSGDIIRSRYEISKQFFETSNSCLILGTPNYAALGDPKIIKIGDVEAEQFENKPRSGDYFLDTPQNLLQFDFDCLVLEDDVLENDAYLLDMFENALTDAGLDWLLGAGNIRLSSRHGLGGYMGALGSDEDLRTARFHAEFLCATPITIYQNFVVAGHVNAALVRMQGKDAIDGAVFQAGRLLFNSLPHMYYMVNGKYHVVTPPPIIRVRTFDFGGGPIEIPHGMLDRRVPGWGTRTPAQLTLKEGEVDRRFRPKNVDNASASLFMGFVKHWRPLVDDELETKQKALDECARRIKAMDEPEEYDRRIERLEDKQDYYWESAVRKKYGYSKEQTPVDVRQTDMAAERARVEEDMLETFKAMCDWRPVEGAFVQSIPRRDYVMMTGGGKSRTTQTALFKSGLVEKHLIIILCPTNDLAQEWYDAFQGLYHDDRDRDLKVRIIKGRSHHCQDEEKDAECAKYEKENLSPREPVCGKCPFNKRNGGTCEWPTIDPNPGGVGIVIMQHAHINSTMQKLQADSDRKAALYIVDELLGAMNAQPIALSKKRLREASTAAMLDVALNDVDEVEETRAYREKLLDALDVHGHDLMMSDIVTSAGVLVDMMAKERTVEVKCDIKLNDMQKQDEFTIEMVAAQRLLEIRRVASFFYELARAIKASVDCERKRVFGVWTSKDGDVNIAIPAVPPAVMRTTPQVGLDATPSPALTQALWGNTHSTSTFEARMTPVHYHLTQFIDEDFSDDRLTGNKWRKKRQLPRIDPYTNDKRGPMKALRQLALYIVRESLNAKKVLVGATKGVCHLLQQPDLAGVTFGDHVHFMWYGNTRGINKYQDVSHQIIIGRQHPPIDIMERISEGMLYENTDIKEIQRWDGPLPRQDQIRWARSPDDRNKICSVRVRQPYHPDPNVNAVFNQICWAENEQMLGRSRILNRTEFNPLKLTVFGTFDTGLLIDDVRLWRDEFGLNKPIVTEMFEDCGVIPSPTSVVIDRMFGGYVGTFDIDFKKRTTKINSRPHDIWMKYRANLRDEDGGRNQTFLVHRKHDQAPDNVRHLIEKHCHCVVVDPVQRIKR